MPLISRDDVERVQLPHGEGRCCCCPQDAPGEWVELKAAISRGDQIWINQQAARAAQYAPARDDDGNPTVTWTGFDNAQMLEASEFAALERLIKAWCYDRPISPETIRDLDPASVETIKVAMNKLYPSERTDEEKKDSPTSSSSPSKQVLTFPPSSPTSMSSIEPAAG